MGMDMHLNQRKASWPLPFCLSAFAQSNHLDGVTLPRPNPFGSLSVVICNFNLWTMLIPPHTTPATMILHGQNATSD